MPKIFIDNKEISVDPGVSILQACEMLGIEIPRFCYHERLSIAGNCRMCLVEMEGSTKPVASCAMPVTEGMKIKTNSEFVKKSRNAVMEFLLINHPLDCPICDQGGECDLQDQAMAYGNGISRYFGKKRAVKDKNLGPIIKTHMTRCIHCTRCVRFGEEIAGIDQIGAVGRGEDTEITTFLEEAVNSELSGNVIDLCPVGALTSKPYAYVARPWELKKSNSIDVMDAVGSNIRIDTKGDRILRVLPRINEEINEEWISDKTRFAYDGINIQRIDKFFIKNNNKFNEIDEIDAIKLLSTKIKQVENNKLAALVGDTVDCESIFSFKHFLEKIKCLDFDCRQDNSFFVHGDRTSYIFNSTITGIDESDLCLLIGCNPKIEASILNAKIRKKYISSEISYPIGRIGFNAKLNFNVHELGESPIVIEDLINGSHKFCKYLEKAKNPLFILGQGSMTRDDSKEIFFKSKDLYNKYNNNKNWNGFNVLQTYSGRVGGLDLEFYSSAKKDAKSLIERIYAGAFDVLYLFAADEIDLTKVPDSTFIVYHGHHGDKNAQNSDLIIPTSCFTEKEGTYINLEGRPQISVKVKSAPPNVEEAWQFFLKTSKELGLSLDYSSFSEIRKLMNQQYPITGEINNIKKSFLSRDKNFSGKIKDVSLDSNIKNFYMTDVVSRHSKVMAECTTKFLSN